METKVCTKCKLEKPIDDFRQRKDRPSRRARCKQCEGEIGHEWLKEHRKTEKGKKQRAKYRRNCKIKGRTNARYIWAKMRIVPRNKKIGFEITLDEFTEFFENMSSCEYCGRTANDFASDAASVREYDGDDQEILKYKYICSMPASDGVRLTIDRADNNGTYSKDNIVACCWFCNSIKGAHIPHSAMKSIGPRLRRDLASRIHA